MRTTPLVLLTLALLSACGTKVEVPKLPALELKNLPLPGTNRVLFELSQGRIELDPSASDALTALGVCADLITYCVAPPDRSLDACVESVPTCATDRPWEEAQGCCPRACQQAYAEARTKGQKTVDAFEATFFGASSCFPGVDALLAGAR